MYSRKRSRREEYPRSGSGAPYYVSRTRKEKTRPGLAAHPQRPFAEEWEQITSWLVANPERSSGDIFRELQRRSPGRYQPSQICTLQRGMRKIRTHLLEAFEEQLTNTRTNLTSREGTQDFLTVAS